MALPNNPIITKFFVNKIESSNEDWPDYLLEIANVFAMFDNQEYDRELLLDQFTTLSQRAPYTLRDSSNFRDEFGAYGTYLGVYRIEEISGKFFIFLTEAAKQYLCNTEPDVEAFCRAQLSLFQYPNGAGAAYQVTATGKSIVRVQANALEDTLREVTSGLKLVPLRLVCRAMLAKVIHNECAPEGVELTYKEIFTLFNDDRTNKETSPSFENIIDVLVDLSIHQAPIWLSEKLTKFKRNFHIFEQTGLFLRISQGLKLNTNKHNYLELVESIAGMNSFFTGFSSCTSKKELESVVGSYSWGRYYDSAANLPMGLLSKIIEPEDATFTNDVELELQSARFPTLNAYDNTIPSGKKYSINQKSSDPEVTRLKREKANRDHARMVNMIATLARHSGGTPSENVFIDLFAELNGFKYIFEMKSCNSNNLLSQVRKGISQLYEYRFRSNTGEAVLCLVLQSKPDDWIIDYLVHDRGIHCCWLIDEITFECHHESRIILAPFIN